MPHWLSQQQWQAYVQRLTMNGSVITHELKQASNWFQMILEPLVYHPTTNQHLHNQPDGLLLLLEDISHHKQIEANLQEAKEAAETASRIKGEFLANMSHELRTPLNIILGFVQLMRRDTTMTPENIRYLNIINRSGQDLLNLINEVLELSRLEVGELRLNENIFDLHELLRNLEEMLQVKINAKHLELVFDCHLDVPHYIKADEHKLRQVLLNLLGNAIKFTEKGSITCRIYPLAAAQTSSDLPSIQPLQFEIQDTGPGIAADELHKLFQPFSQTQVGEATQEGTGLGLAISRRLVNLMGGNISVASTVGHGSTFSFSIPAQAVDLPAWPVELSDHPAQGWMLESTQYRILVVDFNWENRHFLEKNLTKIGCIVRTTNNSEEGFFLWQNWQLNLVFIDIQESTIEGYNLIRRIRDQEDCMNIDPEIITTNVNQMPSESSVCRKSSTILIATSMNIFSGTKAAILAAGFDNCLQNPFTKDELFMKLAKYLAIAPSQMPGRSLAQPRSPASPPGAASVSCGPPRPTVDLAAALRTMPPDWIQQLSHAAIRGSDDRIAELLTEVPESQAMLRTCLADWSSNFQFDEIMSLIQQLPERP
ncbi:ATP-binding protein [Trichothermofontia sp.]